MGHDWLRERARTTPGQTAVVIGSEQWSYGELDLLVDRLCGWLDANGIERGAHIGVLLPNNLTYVCLIHALARLGAVLVPLNTRLTPTELAWQAAEAGCDWILGNTRTDEWKMENGKWIMLDDSWQTTSSFSILNSQFSIQNLQAIVFTSGTTGQPKGAMITFANHFHSALASAYRLGVGPADRWLSVLPLYHVGGLAVIFRSCLYGTAVILHDRFRLDAINYSLDQDAPTLISLVPTMLHRLIGSRTHWPASLRLILLGGAAAPPDLIQQANHLPRQPTNQPLIAATYGLTEAASQVATMLPGEVTAKPGSVGKPLLFTQVRIVDEAGEERPSGEIGEIVVSGPTVMAGYYNNQKATRLRLQHGDLFTGDMGYLDSDGDLWVVQRRSDLIVSGGENVYPAEVEAALEAHPAVAAACVVGLSDPEWGQKVAALVQLAPGETVTAVDLLAFSRQQLAGYKQPRLLKFAAALPHTASGKIARAAVAQQLRDATPPHSSP